MPDNFELIQENGITARKRSSGQGNIFKSVCLSTGGVMMSLSVMDSTSLLWGVTPRPGQLHHPWIAPP